MNIEISNLSWNKYVFNDIFHEYSNMNKENLCQFTVGKYGLIPKISNGFLYNIEKHKSFEPNTLLLGIGADEVGVSLTERGCVSPIYNTFKISKNFDSLFLKYFMPIIIEKNKNNITHISTRRNFEIEISKLKKIQLIIPPLETQQEIGLFLLSIDKQIGLQEQFVFKLENIKKSLLQLILPKENTNVPKLRFKGFTEDWEQLMFLT